MLEVCRVYGSLTREEARNGEWPGVRSPGKQEGLPRSGSWSLIFLIGGKCEDGKSDFAVGPWPRVGIPAQDRV